MDRRPFLTKIWTASEGNCNGSPHLCGMKKLLLLLIIPVISAACQEEPLVVRFKLHHDVEFTIEEGNLINAPFNILTPEVSNDQSAEFASNNTQKEKVQEVYLNYLNLYIQDPPTEDFSFLNEVFIYISEDALGEKLIASKTNIDQSTQELILDVEDVNLADYIKADSYSLRVQTKTDEILGEDVTIKADMEFQVQAQLL